MFNILNTIKYKCKQNNMSFIYNTKIVDFISNEIYWKQSSTLKKNLIYEIDFLTVNKE